MRYKKLANFISLFCVYTACAHAIPNPPFVPAGLDDPDIGEVANFAAQSIQAGNLYRVLDAEKQVVGYTNYMVKIQVVDAHLKFHNFNVEVQVPMDNSAWTVLSSTPVNN
jgi:hypothetical protein